MAGETFVKRDEGTCLFFYFKRMYVMYTPGSLRVEVCTSVHNTLSRSQCFQKKFYVLPLSTPVSVPVFLIILHLYMYTYCTFM